MQCVTSICFPKVSSSETQIPKHPVVGHLFQETFLPGKLGSLSGSAGHNELWVLDIKVEMVVVHHDVILKVTTSS